MYGSMTWKLFSVWKYDVVAIRLEAIQHTPGSISACTPGSVSACTPGSVSQRVHLVVHADADT